MAFKNKASVVMDYFLPRYAIFSESFNGFLLAWYSTLTSTYNVSGVMLPKECRWCRSVQVQSGGKVM